jgi:outer membrane protein insertion porin family
LSSTIYRLFSALILLLLIPLCLAAADIDISLGNKDLSEFLSDVPCVSLKDTAPLKLEVLSKDGLIEVKDSGGIGYKAATLPDAANGYLRMKDVCVIKEIRINGTKRISNDAIRFRIRTAPGDIIHRLAVRKDIEEIYAMGYFESCNASSENNILSFNVTEYPVVVKIEVKGNKKVEEKKILESSEVKKFDILNTRSLKTAVDRIKALYREKGYYNVEVETDTKETDGGIILTFIIKENKKLWVKNVSFDGVSLKSPWYEPWSDPYSGMKKSMKTQNRRWWNPMDWLSDRGAYTESEMDTDLLRLEEYFGNEGYLQAKVGRPKVDIKDDKGIYITVPVEQGPLFTLGNIDAEGELIVPKEKILDALGMKKGDIMSRMELYAGIEKVRDIYMDKGYAYVQIKPITTEKGNNVIDMTLNIKQNKPVHIDEVLIRNNKKTRDKVIRRELKLQETSLFSSTKLRDSRDNLNRLGYFSKVDINQVPSELEDEMDLVVDVEENPTGAFTFGVAYSSIDEFMGQVEVSENNLFGTGLRSKASIEYGAKRKNYNIYLQEPWLFDYPVAVSARVYNQERVLSYYTRESRGFSLGLSFPIIEEVRYNIIYNYDYILPLTDVDPSYEYWLTPVEINGGLNSSITNTVSRVTTNDFYRPTRGMDASVSLEYAGLGGDYHFTRATANLAQFFPLYKNIFALMLKGRWGTINGGDGEPVPTSELYTLGGMNTVRGFDYGDIGPRDNYGNVVGGNRMVVFNAEITFPIGTVPGLSGVVFLDAGNAFNNTIDLENLKKSYGAGIRWVTPMGPLRLEYGWIINPEDYEPSGKWDFTIGAFF